MIIFTNIFFFLNKYILSAHRNFKSQRKTANPCVQEASTSKCLIFLKSFLLFFWWTNSCSSRGYQNIFYVSAVPPIPPISAITEVCSSALSVSAEKNDHPVAAAVVGSSTHTHTHLFVSDRWPTERSSVCVFGYRAVGQLLYLPLVTLIWLCTLTQGTFLFNQAVVFLPRPPSWKNTYFIWRADWEPRAKTRWHHGLILVAVHYMLTSGCQDKFCRILSLISLNGYFSWQTWCPPVVLQT